MVGGFQCPLGSGSNVVIDVLLGEGVFVLTNVEVAENDGLSGYGDVELRGFVGAGQTLNWSTFNFEDDGLLLGGVLYNDTSGGLTLQPVLVFSFVSAIVYFFRARVEELNAVLQNPYGCHCVFLSSRTRVTKYSNTTSINVELHNMVTCLNLCFIGSTDKETVS